MEIKLATLQIGNNSSRLEVQGLLQALALIPEKFLALFSYICTDENFSIIKALDSWNKEYYLSITIIRNIKTILGCNNGQCISSSYFKIKSNIYFCQNIKKKHIINNTLM